MGFFPGRFRALLLAAALLAPSAPAAAQTLTGSALRLTTGPCTLSSGAGLPEGLVTGKVCDRYLDTTTSVTWEKWSGTATTGWRVGFNANAILNGDTAAVGNIGLPGFVSQLSGWRIDQTGAADFRYLFTDSLHAKAFVADLEQALAGGQVISKSVAVLSFPFTCPPLGAPGNLSVEDLPGASGMLVFENGDSVVLRNFLRVGGGLVIGDCVGTVVSAGPSAGGVQAWTFTRGAGVAGGLMPPGTTIPVKGLAIDYGVSGNGYVETNAIDGVYGINSPYTQVVTWTGSPTGSVGGGARTLRTRIGNLRGVTGQAEFGALLGTYGADTSLAYARISDRASELHNLDLSIFSGGTETIRLDHAVPSLAIGSAAQALSFSAGTGIWAGRDSDGVYKFRLGLAGGAGLSWDGASLVVRGTAGSGTNIIRNSECRASAEDWQAATSSTLTPILGVASNFSFDYTLNGQPNTCFVVLGGPTDVPAAGTNTWAALVGRRIPIRAGARYELSAYLGVYRASVGYVQVNWLTTNGTPVASLAGSGCGPTDIAVPGGSDLSRYCRSTLISTAPAGATLADVYIVMAHDGVGANPFVFWVRSFFGEATSTQTEASPWGPAGLTEITGGIIRTGTITADRIQAGSITATQIAARSITADRLSVTTLDAISANIGNIVAGTFNLANGNFTVDSAGILGARVANFGDASIGVLNAGAGSVQNTLVVGALGIQDLTGSSNRAVCVTPNGTLYAAAGLSC